MDNWRVVRRVAERVIGRTTTTVMRKTRLGLSGADYDGTAYKEGFGAFKRLHQSNETSTHPIQKILYTIGLLLLWNLKTKASFTTVIV